MKHLIILLCTISVVVCIGCGGKKPEAEEDKRF